MDISGSAYWVSIPNSAAETDYDAIIAGEVNTEATVTTTLAAGYQMVTYPYPVARSIRDMDLPGSIGDIVYQFNTGTGQYQTSEYKTYADIVDGAPAFITGWATDLSINVGEGFWFYNSITSKDWVANKPF